MPRRATATPSVLAACAVLLLAACGGGGGGGPVAFDPPVLPLSSDTAQGYAADAQATPVLAATAVETTLRVLEAVIGFATQASLTLPCPGGGTVALSISGGTPAQLRNGQLDAGETYELAFSACGDGTAAMTLDGRVRLVVTAYSATAADLTHSVLALQSTTPQGRTTLDGSVRQQRTRVRGSEGATLDTSVLASSGLALASSTNGRNASFELRSLAWTVARTQDAGGGLLARTHQGTLELAAQVPRRPDATLLVQSQGTLTLGADGLVAAGSFSLTTNRDRIAVTYSGNTVQLSLDLGNDGSIDLRWTLTRSAFIGEAG